MGNVLGGHWTCWLIFLMIHLTCGTGVFFDYGYILKCFFFLYLTILYNFCCKYVNMCWTRRMHLDMLFITRLVDRWVTASGSSVCMVIFPAVIVSDPESLPVWGSCDLHGNHICLIDEIYYVNHCVCHKMELKYLLEILSIDADSLIFLPPSLFIMCPEYRMLTTDLLLAASRWNSHIAVTGYGCVFFSRWIGWRGFIYHIHFFYTNLLTFEKMYFGVN